MKIISKTTTAIDNFQRNNKFFGFTYAVFKKYDEDGVGYKVALLTYYGFLSLFPLLLIITTVAGMFASNNPETQTTITNAIRDYIPGIGSQVYDHIHSINKSGFALIAGIFLVLYGARGVVDVFRYGAKDIWHEPKIKSESPIKTFARSIVILFGGASGLILASLLTGLAASAGNGLMFKVFSVLVNIFVLFWVFVFVLKASINRKLTLKKIKLGALLAALGLVALQLAGGIILSHQLKSLDALYSIFAIPLGLIFWIYLQAQVLYLSVVAAAVSSKKLWPRGIDSNNPTAADQISQN